MELRCVKCGELHTPGQCPLNDETTREKFRCANCKKFRLLANYATCEFIKFVKVTNVGNIQSKNKQLDRKIEVLNRGINPQLSFANVTTTSRENFPPLRLRHSQNVINFQQQFYQPAQHQQVPNKETQDQSGVDQLRNEMSSLNKEIRLMGASIQQSIVNNSQRIDFLFNFLGVQHG
ncbi:uncharacterized protein LOC141532069 [Cotesia typhae]|uniref:uncharacterized protein LOC141532069 n=1 Tax=Cotesia typhae TaxID=2053667 RepID=UPI003D68D92A